MPDRLRIAYVGNFESPHSTESHVAASIEALGHEVVRLQENKVGWAGRIERAADADLFLWTSTHGFALEWDQDEAHAAVEKLNGMLPTVGYHLDRWWGLEREGQVAERPFFRLSLVCTADGDNDDRFVEVGVNHAWVPPGVYGAECVRGERRDVFECDVAFVGSWQGGYHREWWSKRRQLITMLRRRYGRRFQCFPRRGQPAVRNQDLNDLYASAKVIVGDQCFADRSNRYISDRLFETTGRGGCLVYPAVPYATEALRDGEHARFYPWGDFEALYRTVDELLADEDYAERLRIDGMRHVHQQHTYERRVEQILDLAGLS